MGAKVAEPYDPNDTGAATLAQLLLRMAFKFAL